MDFTLQSLPENKADLMSMGRGELKGYIESMGEAGYRAGQIFSWLHEKHVSDFSEMTNLSKKLREKLAENAYLPGITIERVQTSKLDGTKKYLFKLRDGNFVEAVLMSYKHGYSLCISSQVGCRMGCKFCASTLAGLTRNLSASEMCAQVYMAGDDSGVRIGNIVIMGIGEPMDNYDSVLGFIRLISDEKGYGLSQRSITVSTCGLVDKIKKLAEEKLSITLALSLHAPDQRRREELMPIAKSYNIKETVAAMKEYENITNRRVTYEYSLVAGVNDGEDAPEKLGRLLGRGAHLNLIPVNPVTERGLKAPDRGGVIVFQKKLEKNGINVTIRRELGRDIDGACGQLRNKQIGI